MSVLGYGLEPFGEGPYGGLGGVILPATTPPLGGYGGYPYGTSSYGSLGGFGDPAIAITGGYGGCAYGTSPYGCIGGLANPPEVIAAISITGFIIEVFFSNEMSPDADLFDPANYTLIDITGAAPATVLSVDEGVPGTWGPTSVLLNHTGTTLGGLYKVVVVNAKDIGGTPVDAYAPLNEAEVLCKGEPPPFTITPLSGSELEYEFEQDMLPEAGFSPGIEELDAYGFETNYPQNIIPTGVTFPFNADPKFLKLDVQGMTSTEYVGIISPATAIDYDGTYLPNDPQADFTGQAIGNGTTTQGTDEILLSADVGFSYGWRFIDTSGKALPGSSYRVDITFDVSRTTSIVPALFDEPFLQIDINDGLVGATLTFTKVAGVDTLQIDSGAFSASSSIDWTTQETTVSLVRNQKADTYTVVVNDEPIVATATANFTGGAGFPAGVQVTMDPNGSYDVSEFPFVGLLYTATQTVFSAAWNFLHNQGAPFVGNGALSKDFLLTKKGPLVKGWGDATPATKQDVAVFVNGISVGIASVNPYYGKIFLEIPIPLMPPGVMEVTVDYIWFPSPIMEMAGLNTLGLVLNKYDCKPLCPTGGNSSGVGLSGGGTNGIEFSRFPMGIVLGPGPLQIRKPLLRSPRFIAFQEAYTAALNSPTTLLLNRNPHQIALEGEQRETEGQIVFYEGSQDPVNVTDYPWELVGDNEGQDKDVNDLPQGLVPDSTTQGYWQVFKTTSGPFGTGETAFYVRDIDISGPSSIIIVVRMQNRTDGENVELDPLPIPDGVFTGVGFGCTVNNQLYMVGYLLINDVEHVGMLVEPAFPEKQESWALAYQSDIEILNDVTYTTDSDSIPPLARERLISDDLVRIQILEGSQTGVYEIIQIVDQTDGSSTVTISSDNPFPADPQVFGNRDATSYFEIRWDGDNQEERPFTYRLVVQLDVKLVPDGFAELFVGGNFAGKAVELDGAPSATAIPPDGVLLYPTGDNGQMFWGSVDRRASNLSDWYFVRYATEPAVTTENFRGIVVAAEMNDLPEEDPNNVWFLTQEFGSRIIDSTGDQLLLKATCSNEEAGVEGQDLTIGYARLEAFLNRRLSIDVDTTFQVDSAVLGAGDLQYVVSDGLRQVVLATILYETTVDGHELLFMPNISLSGLLLPDQEGWVKSGDLTSARVQGQRMQFEQAVGETSVYTLDLVEAGVDPPGDGRIIEARIQVDAVSTTDPDGDTLIFFGADVGPVLSSRGVGIQLRVATGGNPDQVVLFSLETGTIVSAFDYAWNDGELHTYRAIADTDTDTVSLVVDDAFQGTADLTLFDLSSTETQGVIGFGSTVTSSTVEVEDMSVIVLPPLTAQRTLGVWLGGDVDDIDSWELPRTDALTVPNSDLSAVIEEMDWRSRIRLRIHRDPTWGVTILRPDLPPPPFFTGDFATQFTEPSAGWINVEYRYLPRAASSFSALGNVRFGSLDPRSITQSRIDEVRYRIYRYPSENLIMPPHMVLNQYNVITSDEFCKDVTVESDVVVSKDSQTIELTILNVTVDRVFNLQFVNAAGDTVTYQPGAFVFDKETQTITIVSEQTLGWYPSPDIPTPVDPNVDNPSLFGDTSLFPLPPGAGINPTYVPDEFNYPLDTQVPVTVNYMVSKPLTLTYLCKQPLLDGSTLLNEGTPAYETAQVGKFMSELMWGSRINDPNDTLNNDPDFILNDPFRYLGFTKDSTIQYEDIEFCEVSDGESCRLASFCDDSIPGASEAGQAGTEAGDIGNGLIGLDLEGLAFTETEPITFTDGPTGPFGEAVSSTFLKASGGDAPPGGNLQETILFTPLGPQTPPSEGLGGTVGWSVFGQLYDTLTDTVEILFFGTESLGP